MNSNQLQYYGNYNYINFTNNFTLNITLLVYYFINNNNKKEQLLKHEGHVIDSEELEI